MPITNERRLIMSSVKRGRVYFGQDMAEPLVGWLNKKHRTAAETKVVQLLERIQKFTRSGVPVPNSSVWLTSMGRIEFHGRNFISSAQMARWRKTGRRPAGIWVKTDWKDIGKILAAGAAGFLPPDPELVRINKELRRYKLTSSLKFQVEDRWRIAFKPCTKGADIVGMIIPLAEAGLLLRIRRCRECEKWLFARYDHQTFCSPQCRQKSFRESEKGKLHRREYQREYMRKWYRNFK